MDADDVVRQLTEGAKRRFGINEEARAFNLLASFQLVELSLKVYTLTAYDVIALKLGGLVPFNYDERSLERAPLERLLVMFKVVNGNLELQRRLASLVEKRNDIAHRMLLPHFGVRRRDSDPLKTHEDLKQVEDSLSRAMESLAREISSVKQVLAEAAE